MRKIFLNIALMLFVSLGAFAQLDRSIIPSAGPATKLNFGKSTKFELKNGLKVIVVENHKFPTISYSLRFNATPICEGDKAGYVSMAGSLMRAGTTSRTKTQIDDEIDFIAGGLNTGASSIGGHALKKHNEKLLDLICDVTFNPTYPTEELEKERKQSLQSIKANEDDMGALQASIQNGLLYGKETAWGEVLTEETLNNITREDLVKYHHDYIRPNGAYLIIVGDISVKEAKKIAKKRFGQWEAAEVPVNAIPTPVKRTAPVYALGNKDASTQSSISVSYPIDLNYGDDDVMAVMVMNQILGGGSNGKLFLNLREDKAWTYGAYSTTSPGKYYGAFEATANVRVAATDSAFAEIRKEMLNLAKVDVSVEDLQLVKNKLAGSFGRSLESSATLATYAFNIDRYGLPADYYETYMERLEAITVDDVKRVAAKYLTPNTALYVAVGDVSITRPLIEKLAQGAEVKEYDYYVNEVEREVLPVDLLAERVVQAYLDAIGGTDKLKAVKSLAYTAESKMGGMTIEMESIQSEGKFYLDTRVGGNSVSKQIYNGEKAIVYAQGQRQELPEPVADMLKQQAVIFPELDLIDDPSAVLSGADKVNGTEVYVVKAANSVIYFDKLLGLKLKTISTNMGQSTTTVFGNYKEFDGVKIPTTSHVTTGEQSFDIEVTSVEINGEVDESLFEL